MQDGKRETGGWGWGWGEGTQRKEGQEPSGAWPCQRGEGRGGRGQLGRVPGQRYLAVAVEEVPCVVGVGRREGDHTPKAPKEGQKLAKRKETGPPQNASEGTLGRCSALRLAPGTGKAQEQSCGYLRGGLTELLGPRYLCRPTGRDAPQWRADNNLTRQNGQRPLQSTAPLSRKGRGLGTRGVVQRIAALKST